MNNSNKADNNRRCNCGSGKKYKNCCGSSYITAKHDNNDSFILNMEIAYKGEIGRNREKFCIDFITGKQEIFNKISARQKEIVTSKSNDISCKKGCSYCCVFFVSASIQEGEAIVYYLYKNRNLMDTFLEKYPVWREKVKRGGDIFIKPQTPYNRFTGGNTSSLSTDFERGDLTGYALQNIPCPFLINGACSIYEVRPFVCAGLIVTTPNEWCNLDSQTHLGNRKAYQVFDSTFPQDTTFYYNRLKKPVGSFLPIIVYNLLKTGISGIPKIPGLENLEKDYLNDPEIQSVMQKFKSNIDI